jgi:hypothetical protein
MLRQSLSENWVKYVKYVVDAMNNSPMRSLGFLSPSQISSPAMEPYARKAMMPYRHGPEPSFVEQIKNREDYVALKGALVKGEYVMLNFKEASFFTSYDTQVIFLLFEINT